MVSKRLLGVSRFQYFRTFTSPECLTWKTYFLDYGWHLSQGLRNENFIPDIAVHVFVNSVFSNFRKYSHAIASLCCQVLHTPKLLHKQQQQQQQQRSTVVVLFPLLWLRAMWWWEPQEPPKTSMTAKPASAAAAYIQRRLDYVGLKNFQILRLSKTATPQKQTQTFDYSSKLFWVRVASSYYRFCCCSAVFLRIFHSQAMWQMTAKKSCGAWKKWWR